MPTRLGLVLLAMALCLGPPAEAAVRVKSRGPRSATAARTLKGALAKAGVRHAVVQIRVRRGRPWTISVRVFRPGGGRPVLSRVVPCRRGRLSWGVALGLARRAARALKGGKARQPKRREPPIKVEDPGVEDQPPPEPAPAQPPEEPTDQPPPEEPPPETKAPDQPPPPETVEQEQPAAQPAPASTDDENLGFEVSKKPARPRADEDKEPGVKIKKRRKRRGRRRDLERVVVRVGAGFGMAWRRFMLDTQVETGPAVKYTTGLYSQLFVHGEAYPLHLLTRTKALGNLGIRLGYAHSAGLDTELYDSKGEKQSLPTSIDRFWGGLNYLLPRFSNPRLPRFELRVGLAHMGFDVDDNPMVDDLSFTSLAAGGQMVIPVWRRWIEVEIDAEYRMLLRSRSIAMRSYLTKTAGLQGFAAVAGLMGKVIGDLGYRAGVTVERFIGDLPSLDGGFDLLVRDWYVSADLALTYEM